MLKPSEQTPLTALKLATICAELFPPGVVNIVCGRGNTVGAPLVAQPEVRDDLAHRRRRHAARRCSRPRSNGTKRTHLELGGKAPVIVFDDADLESVVSGVRTFGFYNAGQDCTAACRIYAGPKIYDKLVADLSSAASSIKVGTQEEEGVEMGPLITAKQRSRVAGFVQRAAEKRHIEITAGGKARSGRRILLRAHGHRRREADRRDRAEGGVRPGGQRHALQGCRPGHRVGQRLRLRPGVVGVDQGRRQGDESRRAPAVRLHLDQHALHAGERDAARRHEALGLRQGPVACTRSRTTPCRGT